jgi:hypothetical protein
MAARVGNITFDCDDVLKLAAFWSAVLGRPLHQGSSEFFASIGGADGERREPAWYFNKVPEGKCGDGRSAHRATHPAASLKMTSSAVQTGSPPQTNTPSRCGLKPIRHSPLTSGPVLTATTMPVA